MSTVAQLRARVETNPTLTIARILTLRILFTFNSRINPTTFVDNTLVTFGSARFRRDAVIYTAIKAFWQKLRSVRAVMWADGNTGSMLLAVAQLRVWSKCGHTVRIALSVTLFISCTHILSASPATLFSNALVTLCCTGRFYAACGNTIMLAFVQQEIGAV